MNKYLVVWVLLLLSFNAIAQRPARPGIPTPRRDTADLTVRVMLDNNRQPNSALRVQLMNAGGVPVVEAFTDSTGQAHFGSIRSGNYRIRVTGIGVQETNSDLITISDMEMFSFQTITVKREVDPKVEQSGHSGDPISALALNIPDKALREFEKGQSNFQQKKMDEALKHFERATQIYPHYAEAFDLMGITVAQASPAESKQYFERAVNADDQYSPAYTHLARCHVTEKDFAGAEKLLLRGSTLNPRAPETLFLLAYVQLKQDRPEEAIQSASRTHQLEHDQYVLVHFVAGEAYARQGKRREAIEQYSLYLKEAPLGPSVSQAKEAIRMLSEQAKN